MLENFETWKIEFKYGRSLVSTKELQSVGTRLILVRRLAKNMYPTMTPEDITLKPPREGETEE